MALSRSYLTSTKNLSAILSAIQGAQAPDKFTIKFLESLDFKSTTDRLIIGVLKSIGFLGPEGQPTDRYFRFLDQTQSAAVLAEGIREGYSDLFQVNKNAQNLTQAEVVNKLKTLGQGQFSESVLEKMALTYSSLVKLADFKSPAAATPDVQADPTTTPASDEVGRAFSTPPRNSTLGGLHYNIQIILPETRDTVVYDAIFRSLREHLI
ncbi:hypothetical protein SAMN05428969_2917 [Devosia sp. YR412]|uniref:DUF5343 domain-containing protein n=1 Tax=Devosia sp. YR412 TaxID=1881030 RepID=UPI0008D51663|nr:DUF5343 domain-containing protein [Devosia sp. YR412]SEQ39814.1 hypothetical protein SAMN05428969_2917 [Devosia sp. YR412]